MCTKKFNVFVNCLGPHLGQSARREKRMDSKPQLFIVDDDVGFVHAAAEIAREEGFDITVAGTLAQGVSRLSKRRFDLALIDLSLPDGSGLELLDQFDLGDETQIVLVTGQPTVESALKALHSA